MNTKLTYRFMVILVLAVSCKKALHQENTLSEKEKNEGWILLFDGKSLDGWHLYNKNTNISVWQVINNELHCLPSDSTDLEHGDLVTDEEFENYDFKFDWKITKGGNSGVFINVIEKQEIPMAWASGPEYQLLEDSHPDFNADPKKRAGCLYGFYKQINISSTKPAGEWNESRIKQENGKVTFYLNNVITAQTDFKSDEWKQAIDSTGFKNFPEFGKVSKGHIALQDWAKGVSFRNIKIRKL